MADKLNAKKVALALAVTAAVLYIACVLIIALFGQAGVSLFAKMFHGIDIMKIATISVSFVDAAIGLVWLVVLAYLTGLLFAKVYNQVKG